MISKLAEAEVVYRVRIALLTPMLNHFPLLNSVSRDAALTPVSIDNEEFHFICIPIYNFHTYLQYRSKYPRSWSIENKSTCNNLYQTTNPGVMTRSNNKSTCNDYIKEQTHV